MGATIAGIHLGPDTHGNRPAANAAGQPIGALYSCTTHGKIYKTDGSSWSDYATLGSAASGSITSSGYTQSTARLLGRTTGSSGAIEEISVGTGLSLSAGSLTATGGSGISAGTSFPGSPSTNDLCFRTDRGILYFYDGTRWLSVAQYYEILSPDPSAARPQTSSGNGITGGSPSPNYDWWMEAFEVAWYIQTTNDGSKYWTATLRKHAADDTATTVVTITSAADTASNDILKEGSIAALLDHTTYKAFTVVMTKTSTPGNFYWQSMKIRYRLVG